MLVAVMSLSQNISLCHMAPPPGVIAWRPPLIEADDLISSRLILGGEDRSKGSDTPSI